MRLPPIVALAFLCFLNAGQNKGQAPTDHQKTTPTANSQPEQTTAQPQISAPHRQTESKEESKTAQPEPKPWLSHAEWVMAILTAIYVGLTGFYAYVSHKTLGTIEQQHEFAKQQAISASTQFAQQLKVAQDAAAAAQKSADAADRSAQAFRSSQRAWIDTKLIGHGGPIYYFHAINCGHTPAKILYHRIKWEFPRSSQIEVERTVTQTRLLAAPDPWQFEYFDLSKDFGEGVWERIVGGELELVLSGAIYYSDVPDSTTDPQESSFVYCFNKANQLLLPVRSQRKYT